jgi:hypothetical protein
MARPSMPASLDPFIKMVANVFDAHTAALFVRIVPGESLNLVAWESLSPHIIQQCSIKMGHGLIGWVAREGKDLHVTRFDRDTRTLGLYDKDAEIKAFLASPLPRTEGVLMVDSKNRYAFPDKKQRILKDCAEVASALWASRKYCRELDFYRRWQNMFTGPSGDFDQLLAGLSALLGARRGLVAFRKTGQKTFCIKASIGLSETAGLKRRRFPADKGLVSWIFQHKNHLLLGRLGENRQKSYLLWPGEPFERGPALIGIFQPVETGALAWVATDDMDLAGLPKGFADLILHAINNSTAGDIHEL